MEHPGRHTYFYPVFPGRNTSPRSLEWRPTPSWRGPAQGYWLATAVGQYGPSMPDLQDNPSGFQSQRHNPHAAGGTEHLPQLGRHPEPLCQLSWWAALTQHLLATDIEILPGRRNPERRDLVPQEVSGLTDGLTRSPHWPWKRAAAGRSRNSRCSGRDRGASVVRNRSIRRLSLLRWRDVIPADQAAAADR